MKEYAAQPQLWAYSYRLGLWVHHNTHLQALHRVLKHVRLQGREVQRMDKSSADLMRSKMQDRLLKLHKGKCTCHICAIRECHKKSLLLNAANVYVTEHTTYADTRTTRYLLSWTVWNCSTECNSYVPWLALNATYAFTHFSATAWMEEANAEGCKMAVWCMWQRCRW